VAHLKIWGNREGVNNLYSTCVGLLVSPRSGLGPSPPSWWLGSLLAIGGARMGHGRGGGGDECDGRGKKKIREGGRGRTGLKEAICCLLNFSFCLCGEHEQSRRDEEGGWLLFFSCECQHSFDVCWLDWAAESASQTGRQRSRDKHGTGPY